MLPFGQTPGPDEQHLFPSSLARGAGTSSRMARRLDQPQRERERARESGSEKEKERGRQRGREGGSSERERESEEGMEGVAR
jgi:hypothetical protein